MTCACQSIGAAPATLGRRPLECDLEDASRLTYVGHATVLIEVDGARLLTDPVLRPRVAHLRRVCPPIGPDARRAVDAVLISHAHLDHLDLPSLRSLDVPLVIVPRGLGGVVRRVGLPSVVEVEPGDEVPVGRLLVRATPAAHDGRRPPLGPRGPALGFVVEGSQRLYFAGDTDLFPAMADLAPLDAALIPVAGWAPRLGPGHLDARRAAESLRLLRPRLAVPIHWGTFCPAGLGWRPWRFLVEPPQAFARHADELAPEVDVRLLAPGQSLDLPARAG
jgi:L-ascorbate metabolism protein UlaG (beta-lactamase superfamily)